MTLGIGCAMCGKRLEIEMGTEGFAPDMTVRQVIEAQQWIVEINGPHFDIYCSRKCT